MIRGKSFTLPTVRGYSIGPGKRTMYSIWRTMRNSKYSGRDLRYFRSLRGVGPVRRIGK